MLNLLIWPAPELAFSYLPALSATMATTAEDTVQAGGRFLKWLFGPQRPEPRRDRHARVAAIEVAPEKFVGYQGQ